jgi:hypothetical protein
MVNYRWLVSAKNFRVMSGYQDLDEFFIDE